MASSYQLVCDRPDFQAMLEVWEAREGRSCDGDPSATGDFWRVAAALLEQKDQALADYVTLRPIASWSGDTPALFWRDGMRCPSNVATHWTPQPLPEKLFDN
jgi:monomeric isocitrate dehydrogenase